MHKHNDDFTINMINYMSSCGKGSTFRGFINVESFFGIYIGDMDKEGDITAMAIHDEGIQKKLRSDDETKEQLQLDKGMNYLICIYGSDNGSFMKRFDDEKSFDNWFKGITVYKPYSDEDVLSYNS